jgi:hypothetical protein
LRGGKTAYRLLIATCRTGFFNSSCALTFSRPAVSASICFCCLARIEQ